MLPSRLDLASTSRSLSLRKRRAEPVAMVEERRPQRESKVRSNLRMAAIVWIAGLVVFVTLVYSSNAGSQPEEEHIPTPYTERGSYLASSTDWMISDARVVTSAIPSISRLSQSNSSPHPVLSFPKFQSRMYKLTAPDWESYEARLAAFAHTAFGRQLAKWSTRELRRSRSNKRMSSIPSQVWQTGKEIPVERVSFQDLNPLSTYHFYDDGMLEAWAQQHFGSALIKRIWDGMERIVLKADFWRYLVLYLEGGFYSDSDADCLKPIDVWGKVDAVKWDLGDKVSQEILDAPPRVVVGIEVNVPDVTGWETFWPRPIQIVQWTMAGATGHPIYLDSIRRVVESMQVVEQWNSGRSEEANKLFDQLISEEATLKDRKKLFSTEDVWGKITRLLSVDPFDKDKGGSMSLIEATGPGAFSDAVFSYLQARYGIHWTQLHNIQTATRIGDVAILPITGFAPFLKPDWQRWKGIDRGPMAVVGDITHPQAMVNHHFSGSWRTVEDNAL